MGAQHVATIEAPVLDLVAEVYENTALMAHCASEGETMVLTAGYAHDGEGVRFIGFETQDIAGFDHKCISTNKGMYDTVTGWALRDREGSGWMVPNTNPAIEAQFITYRAIPNQSLGMELVKLLQPQEGAPSSPGADAVAFKAEHGGFLQSVFNPAL